jgi:hypothetical protein
MRVTSIRIEWSDGSDGSIGYFANGKPVGSNWEGFEALLALVRSNPNAAVSVKGAGTSLGGEDLEHSVPFADRFSELVDALAGRRLIWDLL